MKSTWRKLDRTLLKVLEGLEDKLPINDTTTLWRRVGIVRTGLYIPD